MKYFKLISAFLALMFVSGCAHQIQMNPEMTKFNEAEKKSSINVGYHISDADRQKQATSSGGGGDKVTYFPYKDIEGVLYTVLSNTFEEAFLVKSLEDEAFLKSNNISVVFIPKIVTTSSSDSLVTWPPTEFTIYLTVEAQDDSGQIVWSKQIEQTGRAEFDEFKHDFSLSARRATEKAFLLLQDELKKATFVK